MISQLGLMPGFDASCLAQHTNIHLKRLNNVFNRSPALIGCFVVDRRYFEEIGLLDEGMEVYGGENVELGIRVRSSGILYFVKILQRKKNWNPYVGLLTIQIEIQTREGENRRKNGKSTNTNMKIEVIHRIANNGNVQCLVLRKRSNTLYRRIFMSGRNPEVT